MNFGLHNITLILTYMHTHLEAHYLSQGRLVPKRHIHHHITQVTLFRVSWSWICSHLHIPINVSIITKSATPGSLGVECFQPLFNVSVELCISSCISSPSSVQVSSRTCHRSFQTYNCSCTLLGGGSLAFHSSQHVGRHSTSALHVVQTRVFSSVCQTVMGVTCISTTNVSQQCCKGSVLKRVYQTMP